MISRVKYLLIGSMFAILTTSNSFARSNSGSSNPKFHKPILKKVQWKGSFRCEEKVHEGLHRSDHECELEFVNAENEEVWSVKPRPELLSLHQKYGGPVNAEVEALSSPRYLFGGANIEIKKITIIEQ